MNALIWLLTAFAAFGGFMFGYDTGVINGVKDTDGFRATFNLSQQSSNGTCSVSEDVKESTILGIIVSIFSVGCLLGALVAGALSEVVGRKIAIIIGGTIFSIGGAVQTTSFYLWMTFLGRIVAGIGVGVLSMVVPIYIAELAPKSHRGRLVSLYQLATTGGTMIGFVTDLVAAKFTTGWRGALGMQCVFGIVFVVGMLFLPETPRWLSKKHKNEKALKTLAKLRRASTSDVHQEMAEIEASLKKDSGAKASHICRALLKWNTIQRLLIGVLIQLFQKLSGMNVIMYYSTSIFCKIGVARYISTSVLGTINFLTTILSMMLIDKVGRKALLLVSGIGMLVSIVGAATVLMEFRVAEEEQGSVAGYVAVVLVCLFVFNFSYGWGPIAWVVTSEIYPLSIRGIAVSITTTANWSGNFIIAFVSPFLLNSSLQTHGTFYIMAGSILLANILFLFTLPETKGISLERMDELFSKPWLQRTNLFYYLRLGCPWRVKRRQVRYRVVRENEELQSRNDDVAMLLQHTDAENETSFITETDDVSNGHLVTELNSND